MWLVNPLLFLGVVLVVDAMFLAKLFELIGRVLQSPAELVQIIAAVLLTALAAWLHVVVIREVVDVARRVKRP